MHYYPHHIGDYRASTASLSLTQHGVYRSLMDEYYVTGRPVTADLNELYRICRAMSKLEKDAVECVASRFFVRENDVLTHARIDAELAKCADLQEKASRAGKASAAKKAALQNVNARSTPVQRPLNSGCNMESTEWVTDRQPSNNQYPITISANADTPVVPKGTRTKSGPVDDETWLQSLEKNEAYAGINIRQELGRCQAWCGVRNQKASRQRFVNWLNRAERPISAQGSLFQSPRPPKHPAYSAEAATAGIDLSKF